MKAAETMNETDRKIASMYMAGNSTFLEGKNKAARSIIEKADQLERQRRNVRSTISESLRRAKR